MPSQSAHAAMSAPVPSDDVLLKLFANGDTEAAKDLTRRLAPNAYGLAMRMLGDGGEAEDVAQEAMLRLWRMAPDWQQDGAKVSTWLYRVVMNLCLDVKRKRHGGLTGLQDLPEPADPGQGAQGRMLDSARSKALHQALLHLPQRQRQAVVLRHLQELSNPEIAGIMQISTEAVESLTSRGKRALAKVLATRRKELGYLDD